MALPDYIIIGTQKSATTFVHESLRSHPQIYGEAGEITVFRDLRGHEDEVISYFDNLLAQRDKASKKVIGIKYPEYLADPYCAVSIKKVVPRAKFIVVLRNPIERIVSAYYHYVSAGLAPLIEINQGLPEIMQGRHFMEYPKCVDLVEYGFYFKHLKSYLSHFHREQFLILLYEDVTSDPVRILKETLKFLNVDNSLPLRFPKQRLGKTVSSLQRLRFHRWRNPIVYGFDHSAKVVFVKTNFGEFRRIFFGASNLFDRRILSAFYKSEKPKLSPDIAARLLEIYREDIISLETLLARDLRTWKTIQE